MKFTEEMIAEDEQRWHWRDIVTELGYCSANMKDRRNITNLDIRFYAYLMRKAHDMLKAQEPRVMTLEEIEDWDGAVFFEAYETDMYYALIETVELTAGMDGEFVFVNVEPGEHHRRVWGGENYGSIWRCWTSRPTDEQMEKTPWQ